MVTRHQTVVARQRGRIACRGRRRSLYRTGASKRGRLAGDADDPTRLWGMSRQCQLAIVAGILLLTAVAFARSLPIVVPSGDMALMDIHQLSVARDLEPVGSYSRHGWRHPGPLYAAVQLPVFWLSGYRHLSTSVTAMLMNVSALLLTGWVLWRRARTPAMAIAGVVCMAAFLIRVPGLVANPWNAFVPILLLPLLVTATAAGVTGRLMVMPAAVGLASLMVQAHVGFTAPVIAVLLLAAIGVIAVAAGISGAVERSAITRTIAAAGIIGALAWALPLWDAVSPHGSRNLQKLYTFFSEAQPHDPELASAAFVRYFTAPFANALDVPGGAIVDVELGNRRLALAQMMLLMAAALIFTVRRRTFEATWSWTVIVTTVVSYLATRRLPEAPLDHTVFWVSMLGVMSWTAILAGAGEWIRMPRRFARTGPLAPKLAWAAVAVVLIVTGATQVRARAEIDASPQIRSFTSPLRTELERSGSHAATLLVTQDNWSDMAGVAYQLYRDGFDLQVPSDWVWMFGRAFTPTRQDVLTFGIGDASASEFVDARVLIVSATPVYIGQPRVEGPTTGSP